MGGMELRAEPLLGLPASRRGVWHLQTQFDSMPQQIFQAELPGPFSREGSFRRRHAFLPFPEITRMRENLRVRPGS